MHGEVSRIANAALQSSVDHVLLQVDRENVLGVRKVLIEEARRLDKEIKDVVDVPPSPQLPGRMGQPGNGVWVGRELSGLRGRSRSGSRATRRRSQEVRVYRGRDSDTLRVVLPMTGRAFCGRVVMACLVLVASAGCGSGERTASAPFPARPSDLKVGDLPACTAIDSAQSAMLGIVDRSPDGGRRGENSCALRWPRSGGLDGPDRPRRARHDVRARRRAVSR